MSKFTPYSSKWYAENRSRPLHNVSIAFIVLQPIFVCLFLKARMMKKTLWSADVWFVVLGYTWNLVLSIAALFMIKTGLGKHMIVVIQASWTEFVTGLKLLLVQQFAYVFAVTFPKLAILYLYLKLFNIPVYRRITYIIGSVIILSLVTLTITTFLICRPLAFNWNKLIKEGRCGNLGLLFKLVSIPNLITDLAILILPMPVIWKLQMKMSQKIGLTITFLTGSFGILTAILRLYYFSAIRNLYADVSYDHITTECWTIIEPSCYLIAAMLPSLRPLLKVVNESSTYNLLKSRAKLYYTYTTTRRTSKETDASSSSSSPSISLPRTSSVTKGGEIYSTEIFLDKGPCIAITREYAVEHLASPVSEIPDDEWNEMWNDWRRV